MAIRQFAVGPLRGLSHAQASGLGNLVVIAGSNGAGKSSLLELLRSQRDNVAEPGTVVLSAGAHRTWRPEVLTRAGAYSLPMASLRATMALDTWPVWQFGMPRSLQQIGGHPRSISGADEAQSFVKAALVKLDDRQSTLVNIQYRAGKAAGVAVPEVDAPDLFAPFERLVRTLLPHLRWIGVEATDPANIQCQFQAAGGEGGPIIDIDDLSSGEKAAISLMLPFVEQQADHLASDDVAQAGLTPVTVLLDEPEIHLHPLLQLQVLDYLRELAKENTAQFIMTTHSPTILDALDDSELWLLSPATLRPDNQLSRLTTARERLEVARTVTGSTHLLTRAKPIVFVEGEAPRAGLATDVRLVAKLLPGTASWAVVAGRSKREVVASVKQLRQQNLDLPGVPVFGLVDADRDVGELDPHVFSWPVAMIENLLLDANAIFDALQPFKDLTGANDPEAVMAALRRSVVAQVDDEVRLRVKRQVPTRHMSLEPSELDRAEVAAREKFDAWLEELVALNPIQMLSDAKTEVQKIVDSGGALERFHGKRLFQRVFKDLNVQAAMSQPAFQLAVADRAAGGERIERLARPVLEQVRLFFPADLAAAVRGVADSDGESLAADCEGQYMAWKEGAPTPEGRAALRDRVFSFARDAGEHRAELVSLAAEIGTP